MTLRFSGDYLPSMWSDMDFFPRLMQEKQQAFDEVQKFVRCPKDANMLENLRRTAMAAVGSIMAESIFLAEKGKIEKRDLFVCVLERNIPGSRRRGFSFWKDSFHWLCFAYHIRKRFK